MSDWQDEPLTEYERSNKYREQQARYDERVRRLREPKPDFSGWFMGIVLIITISLVFWVFSGIGPIPVVIR